MKRGIIRIIAGIVMIILQILPMIGQSSVENTYNNNVWYNIGYYSVGITGSILLFFGIRVSSDGFYSQLILHNKTKKIHTITKWVMFSISTLLFLFYVISLITSWSNFSIFSILMIFATLSFALYMLLYVYKKPCCLFSTALIFTGVAYLYGLISNLTYYILYLSDMDNYSMYVIFGIIPRLTAGILYIIIAVKLYKEKFSVKVIKALGWIAFALELMNRVLCNLIVFQTFYFYDISGMLFILLTVGILLYTSVFEINTLRGIVVVDNDDTIRFCRKCGTQLLDGSEFCGQCGTEIVE